MAPRKGKPTIDQYTYPYTNADDLDVYNYSNTQVPNPGGQPININININLGDIIAQIAKGLKTPKEAIEEVLEERSRQRKQLLESRRRR